MSNAKGQISESSIRKRANKLGFSIQKSRQLYTDLYNQGMYALANAKTGTIIAGRQYQLSFTFISDILDEYEANPNMDAVLRKMESEGRLGLMVRPYICEAARLYMSHLSMIDFELIDDNEIPNIYAIFEVAINALSIMTKAEFYKTLEMKGNKSYTNEVIGDKVIEELYNDYKSDNPCRYGNAFFINLLDVSARLAFLQASSGDKVSNRFDDFREEMNETVIFIESDDDNEYGYFRHYGTCEWIPMTKPESEYREDIANGDYSSLTAPK